MVTPVTDDPTVTQGPRITDRTNDSTEPFLRLMALEPLQALMTLVSLRALTTLGLLLGLMALEPLQALTEGVMHMTISLHYQRCRGSSLLSLF